MWNPERVTLVAQQTISTESEAIKKLSTSVNSSFEAAVKCIHQATGRVVITGIGKSAIIAQKIAATLNSTGTPALFMHAADAIHGDLGMVLPEDVVVIISKSGESPEIKVLIPFIRNFGNPIIAICGKSNSYLAENADFFIDSTVEQEACPNNLAPTSSTTAQMVMGDALAVCLLDLKGFSAQDFARFHPGGALGKQLYLKVEDLSKKNEQPQVLLQSTVREIILEMTGKRLGATAVCDSNNHLLGIITDGDLRRMLNDHQETAHLTAEDIMTPTSISIEGDALAILALELMRQHNISQVIVTRKGHYEGMVHLHDLIREGLI